MLRASVVRPKASSSRNGGGMQERQVAEAAVQLVVAHRQLGVDVLLLREPGDGGPLVAEFVDQLEVDALVAGEHAAVGDAAERLAVEMPARPAPGRGTRRRNP